MWTLAIVFSINKLVDTMGKLFHRLEFPQIKVLIFQCVVETFHGSIVVRTASSTHALLHVVLHADTIFTLGPDIRDQLRIAIDGNIYKGN